MYIQNKQEEEMRDGRSREKKTKEDVQVSV